VNRVAGSWLSGVFEGVGFEAWLVVDIEDGDDWATLCEFLERPDLVTADADDAARLEPELREVLGAWVAQHTPYTAMRLMQNAGLAAAVVQTSEDLWRDPQLHVRGFPTRIDQADVGSVTYPGSAQHWTKTPGMLRHIPARLGEHTNEVLREWIGLPDDELLRLSQDGAIFDAS
jgi:crotonobetainyl-CoA:carnitine CoA-transferase CaiB-like acyl-CoA transferase